MVGYIDQRQKFVRISELINQRDDLEAVAKECAGKANFFGFKMHRPEHIRDFIELAEWVKASLNPFTGVMIKLLTKVLANHRNKKTTSAKNKRLILASEALIFWGKQAYEIATNAPVTPWGIASLCVSVGLKAGSIGTRFWTESLEKSMKEYWKASEEFQLQIPFVIAQLNKEIDQLK